MIAPQFGSKDGDVFVYGSVVKFSCFPGYELKGSNESVCQADTEWSSPVPSCTGKSLSLYIINSICTIMNS